jgi:hypothetical protein
LEDCPDVSPAKFNEINGKNFDIAGPNDDKALKGLALDSQQMAQEKLMNAMDGNGKPFHHATPPGLDVSDIAAVHRSHLIAAGLLMDDGKPYPEMKLFPDDDDVAAVELDVPAPVSQLVFPESAGVAGGVHKSLAPSDDSDAEADRNDKVANAAGTVRKLTDPACVKDIQQKQQAKVSLAQANADINAASPAPKLNKTIYKTLNYAWHTFQQSVLTFFR